MMGILVSANHASSRAFITIKVSEDLPITFPVIVHVSISLLQLIKNCEKEIRISSRRVSFFILMFGFESLHSILHNLFIAVIKVTFIY